MARRDIVWHPHTSLFHCSAPQPSLDQKQGPRGRGRLFWPLDCPSPGWQFGPYKGTCASGSGPTWCQRSLEGWVSPLCLRCLQ